MGDLRNKIAKQYRDEDHKRWLEEHCPPKPKPVPPKCVCGHTPDQVPNMWAQTKDRWQPSSFWCPTCLPDELVPLLMPEGRPALKLPVPRNVEWPLCACGAFGENSVPDGKGGWLFHCAACPPSAARPAERVIFTRRTL